METKVVVAEPRAESDNGKNQGHIPDIVLLHPLPGASGKIMGGEGDDKLRP
jgi:hypothetical protein